jgi:hypothetical protein
VIYASCVQIPIPSREHQNLTTESETSGPFVVHVC